MKKCCICGKEIEGYGNNPWPISTNEEDLCCDECNFTIVVPKRIEMLQERYKDSLSKKKV